MNKEQILAITGLTVEQKERVEAAFTAAERIGKPCKLTTYATEAEVKNAIQVLITNYAKRVAAKGKKAERVKAAIEEQNAVKALVEDAKKYGFTVADITAAVKGMIKDKKNAEINAKIAALQAELID